MNDRISKLLKKQQRKTKRWAKGKKVKWRQERDWSGAITLSHLKEWELEDKHIEEIRKNIIK